MHLSGFYCFSPENPVFYIVKVKNENHLRVKFGKQKLFHIIQVTVTFFFYYGEISKIREKGFKNLDFGLLID